MRSAVKAGLAIVVLMGAAYFFVFPARTYLGQKSAIAAEQRTISVLHTENGKLTAERKDLDNDATIERIGRQDYDLVKPGQQAFMVLPSPQAPPTAKRTVTPAQHHWYSDLELWRHL